MRLVPILSPLFCLALAACGSDGGSSSITCSDYCVTARTCDGKTGWKTNDCTAYCADIGTVNAAGNCGALFNSWLSCEDGQAALICSGDPCGGPYMQWFSCRSAYCSGSNSPPACSPP